MRKVSRDKQSELCQEPVDSVLASLSGPIELPWRCSCTPSLVLSKVVLIGFSKAPLNPKEVVSMTDCIGTLFDRFIVFQIHNLLIGLVETPMNGEQSLGYPSDSCGAPGQVMAKADIVRLGQKRPLLVKAYTGALGFAISQHFGQHGALICIGFSCFRLAVHFFLCSALG